jgi:hypothetical protein
VPRPRLALGRLASVSQSLIVAARLTADADPCGARFNAKAERVLSEAGEHLSTTICVRARRYSISPSNASAETIPSGG